VKVVNAGGQDHFSLFNDHQVCYVRMNTPHSAHPTPTWQGESVGHYEGDLGGRWYTFDARNNVPRIGRVLMARGRDVIDVAIATTFGPNTLVRFKVWTDEVMTG
jgi:hypothetical protein